MDWLGASLAFATTMFALSIVVTSTVETIHRVFRLREKGLHLMLGHFYDAALESHVDRVLPAMANVRAGFLDAMTSNRAPGGEAMLKLLNRIWNGGRLGSLGLDDFMGRLGDSPVGDAVARVATDFGPEAADTILRDLAHKFDEFGRDTSVYFEARARLLSVIVAFVLAWQGYVHPYELFSTFLKNPTIAKQVNEQASKMVEQYDATQEKLNETRERVGNAAPTAADTEQLQKDMDAIHATVASLANAGVPIGWTDARRAAAGFEQWGLLVYPHWNAAGLTTAAWLLLGGILVGLGGPFWRDLVLSLTNLRGGAETEKRKIETATGDVVGDARIAAAAQRFLTASRARGVVVGEIGTEDETDKPVG